MTNGRRTTRGRSTDGIVFSMDWTRLDYVTVGMYTMDVACDIQTVVVWK